jgi:hypothetical protein
MAVVRALLDRKRVAGTIISVVLAVGCEPARQPSAEQAGEPWASLRAMGNSLHRAAEVGENADAAGSDRENADGGRYLAEILLSQARREIFTDPDFPAFRPQYPESAHTGLVNPDNLYESARIRPGTEYIIRGIRGTTADVVFQVYEGSPGVKGSLKGLSTISADKLRVAKDGRFEIRVGPTPSEGNWLDSGESGKLLLVRWSHSDWETERAGRLEIVRVGGEGEPRPNPQVAQVAERIRAAGEAVPDAGQFWLDFVDRIRLFSGDNDVMAPRATGGQGLEGQVSAMGRWRLEEDEALVLTVPKIQARYQGVQLGNLWFDALDWANRQTSLSGGQARLGGDGRYHYVISARDPGVPNWLDTTSLPEGLFFIRFQGLEDEIPEAENPRVQLVKTSEVRRHLPDDAPVIDGDARRAQLAARQIQIQRRFGR